MRDGPGVDRVEDLRALSFADGEIGTALCLDTLEHCEDPIAAGRELSRVVSPDGGTVIVSSVMLMPIHGYPSDYWRFTPAGLRLAPQGSRYSTSRPWATPTIPSGYSGLAFGDDR